MRNGTIDTSGRVDLIDLSTREDTMSTLTTTIIGPHGTYWLGGWREAANGTARFNLVHESEYVVANGDWPTTWDALHRIMKHDRVEATMRAVLPS